MTSRPKLRPSRTTALSSGTTLVVLGLLTYVLSRGRDGFDKGLFIGATIAFMVLGAYLLGATTFRRGGDDAPADDTDTPTWLPSRDDH